MKKMFLSTAVICLSAVLGVVLGLSKEESKTTGNQRIYAQCIVEYSEFNDLLEIADVILIGTVNDIVEHTQYDEYIVDVDNVCKGEVGGELSIRNYLFNYCYLNNGDEYSGITNTNYTVGKRYAFVLQHIENVYEDRYVILADIFIPVDTTEDSTMLSETIQDISNPVAYITDHKYSEKGEGESLSMDYIESDNMAEIVDFSPYIAEVEILDLYRTTEFTDIYLCRVVDVIKGSLNVTEENTIIVPFFKDTVESGENFIVNLISDTTDSLIYSLSSKHSVMNISERVNIQNVLNQN